MQVVWAHILILPWGYARVQVRDRTLDRCDSRMEHVPVWAHLNNTQIRLSINILLD